MDYKQTKILFLLGGILFLSACFFDNSTEEARIENILSDNIFEESQNKEIKEVAFSEYIVNLDQNEIRFYHRDEVGDLFRSFAKVKEFLFDNQKELVFATNGGIFMEDRQPLGLYIENGKEIRPINNYQNEHGNFYLQPNGIFLLTDDSAYIIKTNEYPDFNQSIKYATQSGPMLVIDGEINPLFDEQSNNFNLRNGVGIRSAQEVVFVISNRLVTFFELADYFKNELNCNQALYLDGAISQMYAPEIGKKSLGGDFGIIISVIQDL